MKTALRDLPLSLVACLVFEPGTLAASEPTDDWAACVHILSSSDFSVRQQATHELEKGGARAIPALAQALQSTDIEVRTRALSLITGYALSSRADLREPARQAIHELAH